MTTAEQLPPGAVVIAVTGEAEVIKGGEQPAEDNDTDEEGDQ